MRPVLCLSGEVAGGSPAGHGGHGALHVPATAPLPLPAAGHQGRQCPGGAVELWAAALSQRDLPAVPAAFVLVTVLQQSP